MADDVLRVVVAKRGRVKPAEFRLRPGEVGLSLFLHADPLTPADILSAVRDAGKQGELAVVELPVRVIRELGLRLVRTPGGTPNAAVNRVHVEARLPWWRRAWLGLRRRPLHEFFNARYAQALADASAVLDVGGDS